MRLIDANALMNVIQKNDYMLTANHNSMAPGMFTSGIRQAVDEAPTIDPVKHGKWIPVNERLPELFKNVLCFFPYKNYGSQIEVSYFESNSGVCADAHKYNAPTHWMPLPEPPKMDGEV